MSTEQQTNYVVNVEKLQKTVAQGNDTLTILKNINLSIKSGESCALIGESGSGKSTLLAILAGLDDGTSGEVSLLGQSLTNLNEDERALLRAKGIGFVFQSFLLVPTLTALENVQLPMMLKPQNNEHKYDETQAKKLATELLSSLGLEKG